MITITDDIQINEDDLQWSFVRSPGPGGQNVNKVATAVHLSLDVTKLRLSDLVMERLTLFSGRRLSDDGILTIQAHRHRTRERNRADALARLIDLFRRAADLPKKRKATRPPARSKERRMENKKRRSDLKRLRKPIHPGD